jgi:hypothetical protein
LPPPLALRGCFQPVRVRSRSTPASRSGGDDARGSGHESPRTRSPRATPMASTKGQLQHGSAQTLHKHGGSAGVAQRSWTSTMRNLSPFWSTSLRSSATVSAFDQL